MREISALFRNVIPVLTFLVVLLLGSGCGSGISDRVPCSDGDTVFYSARHALNGTNAVIAAKNVWKVAASGEAAPQALTQYTSPSVEINDMDVNPKGTLVAMTFTADLNGDDSGSLTTTNLWTLRADGSGLTPQTTYTATTNMPDIQFSSSGNGIFYDSSQALNGSDAEESGSTRNLWYLDLSTGDSTPFTPQSNEIAQTFDNFVRDPVSSNLFFVSNLDLGVTGSPEGTKNIWRATVSGSLTPITSFALEDTSFDQLAVSPDGKWLGYVSNRAPNGLDEPVGVNNLWLTSRTGGTSTRITNFSAGYNFVTLSFDSESQTLSYSSNRPKDGGPSGGAETVSSIWVYDISEGTHTLFTNYSLMSAFPFFFDSVWDRFLYASNGALDGSDGTNTGSTLNFWKANLDGTDGFAVTRITVGSGNVQTPRLYRSCP